MLDTAGLPEGIDPSRPTAARIYDYFVGGSHYFESDRQVAEKMLVAFPYAREAARINRSFLRRTVEFMVAHGIEQFLDIGAGVPATGNVHEVAQALRPGARVVYVDVDPVPVAHGRKILAGNPDAVMLQGDLHQPEAILDHPETRRLIDFSKPVGLLLLAVLHFFGDDAEVKRILTTLRERMAPGSFLVISHTTLEGLPAEVIEQMRKAYAASTSTTIYRPREGVRAMFDGFALVEPGLVYTAQWRPDGSENAFDSSAKLLALSGVGRKR